MDRLIAPNSVPLSGADLYPSSGTPQYATDGSPIGPIPPTIWPAYVWNMIGDEIRNAITGAGLTPDGTNWGQLFLAIQAIAGGAGSTGGIQGFSTAGTFSFTVPANVHALNAKVTGGGGGSGSCAVNQGAGAGGAGGTEIGRISVTPGQVITFTVGAAGIAGVAGAGGTGGTSSFGGLSATGGVGGQPSAAAGMLTAAGGQGGSGSGGAVSLPGGYGGDGHTTAGGDSMGGEGGVSYWGGGGRGAATGGAIAGQAPGSGAGGPYAVANNGAAGAAGEVFLEW